MHSIITTVTWSGLKTALEWTKHTPVHIPQAVYADHYKTPQLPPTLCHNPLPLQPPVCRSLQLWLLVTTANAHHSARVPYWQMNSTLRSTQPCNRTTNLAERGPDWWWVLSEGMACWLWKGSVQVHHTKLTIKNNQEYLPIFIRCNILHYSAHGAHITFE